MPSGCGVGQEPSAGRLIPQEPVQEVSGQSGSGLRFGKSSSPAPARQSPGRGWPPWRNRVPCAAGTRAWATSWGAISRCCRRALQGIGTAARRSRRQDREPLQPSSDQHSRRFAALMPLHSLGVAPSHAAASGPQAPRQEQVRAHGRPRERMPVGTVHRAWPALAAVVHAWRRVFGDSRVVDAGAVAAQRPARRPGPGRASFRSWRSLPGSGERSCFRLLWRPMAATHPGHGSTGAPWKPASTRPRGSSNQAVAPGEAVAPGGRQGWLVGRCAGSPSAGSGPAVAHSAGEDGPLTEPPAPVHQPAGPTTQRRRRLRQAARLTRKSCRSRPLRNSVLVRRAEQGAMGRSKSAVGWGRRGGRKPGPADGNAASSAQHPVPGDNLPLQRHKAFGPG